METLLFKFTTLLQEEINIQSSLLSALQKEKSAVINTALEELNDANKEKENALLKIRILEEQRLSILKKLAGKLGDSPENLTLKKLSQIVDEPHAADLKRHRSTLKSLTQSIQELIHSNKALLLHSLKFVRGSLNFLNNLTSSTPIYYRTGRVQSRMSGGKMLSGRV